MRDRPVQQFPANRDRERVALTSVSHLSFKPRYRTLHLHDINADQETPIAIRQVKYHNNIVEQDHRAMKRRTRPMLGFKEFRFASIPLRDIEMMHIIAKRQMQCLDWRNPFAADALLLAA